MLDSRIVVDDKLDEKALELSNNDTRLLAEDVGMLSLELSLSKEADEFATKSLEPWEGSELDVNNMSPVAEIVSSELATVVGSLEDDKTSELLTVFRVSWNFSRVSEPILEEGIYESYADESEFAEDSAAAEVKQLEYVHSLESDNSKLVDEYSISELAVEVGFDEIWELLS